jgi:beta-glucosidase-like glycosyl hydrolase
MLGEDPTLAGEYGAQFIAGFQGANASVSPNAPMRSSSCAKHFFGYNLENCYTFGDNCRLNFNAVTDQRDIEDTYLVSFHDAVERVSSNFVLLRCKVLRSNTVCVMDLQFFTAWSDGADWKFDRVVFLD